MSMGRIIDLNGNPIDTGALKEPQTSRIAALQNQYLTSMLGGLTPARLVRILKSADDGHLVDQHRLFADMEDRDPHLVCEIGKRKLAVMGLDWDIVPPRNATAKEKADAEWVKEMLTDAVDPIEDLILALMDGVGHGFAAVEIAWSVGKERLPTFYPCPQEWFQLSRDRRELRLLDHATDGAALRSFGWVLHTHGKPKTGYLGRMGLHRVLVWPFLYKAYGLGDFAEFLETYGLPIVVGKYYQGASAEEKASLMRAVTALGHDARAIMPADMQLEIQKITGGGDSTPHLAMMGWADDSMSKAILGQVLSASAKATGMGSGVADLHGEVRDDIRDADARQIAGTITRDVIYAMLALNRGIDSLSRCARMVFDTGEAENLQALATGVKTLRDAGVKTIPVSWVHEKGRIPVPKDGEATVGGETPDALKDKTKAALAALAAYGFDGKEQHPWVLRSTAVTPVTGGNPRETPPFADQAALDAAIDAIPPQNLQAMSEALLAPILKLLDEAGDFDQALALLAEQYPRLDTATLEGLLGRAMFAAELHGRASVIAETTDG
jgi:phage gp29-like protein